MFHLLAEKLAAIILTIASRHRSTRQPFILTSVAHEVFLNISAIFFANGQKLKIMDLSVNSDCFGHLVQCTNLYWFSMIASFVGVFHRGTADL